MSERHPPLRGGLKQIAWAEAIRASIVSQMDRHKSELVAWLEQSRPTDRLTRARIEEQSRAFRLILRQTDASWWIEHRGLTLFQLAELARKKASR